MYTNEYKIHVVVVTYNRKVLLEHCLNALSRQTRPPDRIVVVDNASTDGTREMLSANGWANRTDIDILLLPDNRGGAGGFASGIQNAVENDADFSWIMDDDALPEPDALEKLLSRVSNDTDLYGSIPVAGDRLAWRLARTDVSAGPGRYIHNLDQVPDLAPVEFLPFLGLLVSSALVRKIGLPDAGFFLAADDVDFCFRARKAGAKVMAVGGSRLRHPASELYFLRLPFKKLWCLRLPPWKRYYDVRNRLFVARNHYGLAIYYKTIPGSVLRLIGALLYEDQRLRQIKAFWAGMVDGLLGRKGRRHELWGL